MHRKEKIKHTSFLKHRHLLKRVVLYWMYRKHHDWYFSRKVLFLKYIEIFLTFYLYNNVYMVCIVRLILLYLGLCFYSLMILFWSIHRILLHPRHPKHYHLALFRMLNGFCHEQHLPIQQMETKIVNRNTSL